MVYPQHVGMYKRKMSGTINLNELSLSTEPARLANRPMAQPKNSKGYRVITPIRFQSDPTAQICSFPHPSLSLTGETPLSPPTSSQRPTSPRVPLVSEQNPMKFVLIRPRSCPLSTKYSPYKPPPPSLSIFPQIANPNLPGYEEHISLEKRHRRSSNAKKRGP